jgi:RNA-binding protein
MELTGTQRKRLRGLAHSLKPVVQVGQQGLSDPVVDEVGRALDRHELVKVKIAGERDDRRALAAELARRLDAALAGTLGTTAILYRRHPDPAARKIALA